MPSIPVGAHRALLALLFLAGACVPPGAPVTSTRNMEEDAEQIPQTDKNSVPTPIPRESIESEPPDSAEPTPSANPNPTTTENPEMPEQTPESTPVLPSRLTSHQEGDPLVATTETFTWSQNGAAAYDFHISAIAQAGKELFDSNALGRTSTVTVDGLPSDGSPLYVRLWWQVDGEWQYQDYTFTAADIDTPPPIPSPASGSTDWESFYGTPWSADSLANLDIGGRLDARIAYRFRAKYTGTIHGLRVHLISNTASRAGYASGTGGTIQLSMHPDDGAGSPDETKLLGQGRKAAGLIEGYLPIGSHADKLDKNFPLVPLEAQLTEGTLYHVVFDNIDPAPRENYLGINQLFQRTPELGPRLSIEDWGLSVSWQGDPWRDYTTRDNTTLYQPILSVAYEDGRSFGMGSIESFYSYHRPIDSQNLVRVTFTPAQDFVASSFWIRAWATTENGGMEVHVEDESGTVSTIQIPASDFVRGSPTSDTPIARWIEVPWSIALKPGVEHRLTLRGVQGGRFEAQAIRDGKSYAFDAGATFEGVTRSSSDNGATWAGWHKNDKNPVFVNADLQMAFRR